MKSKSITKMTKLLLDFMFYTGIIVCIGVPYLLHVAGDYFSIFRKNYMPFTIIFIIAGILGLLILRELRKMFRTVLSENAFCRENVISLQKMGVYAFVIAIDMTIRLIFVITPAALVIILVFLVAGLFSLVLSQVFDQAVQFKEENDLTI